MPHPTVLARVLEWGTGRPPFQAIQAKTELAMTRAALGAALDQLEELDLAKDNGGLWTVDGSLALLSEKLAAEQPIEPPPPERPPVRDVFQYAQTFVEQADEVAA